ncbi:MAG: FAD-binding protein, partial [Verrucomicrobia bacterium]|nr:FAD-binding protein [Verrucomicrobiota bacterium]
AAAAGLAVIPRGAGSGLTGGAIGDGVVVDFARHNRRIGQLDVERNTIRVGAGVVLDQLNDFLRPYKLWFAPDVATSSRATIGGMIGNNSSGARTPIYGMTVDHVKSVEVVLADGSITNVGEDILSLPRQMGVVESLVEFNGMEIAENRPPGLLKRWPGYAIERCLNPDRRNLVSILCGSEGTLAGIFSAELKLVPLPKERALGILFFDSVAEAMQATVELQDLKPAAIEHLDRPLLDQTRGQLEFEGARDLLDLDERPCESILAIEFFDEVQDKLAALERRKLGRRKLMLTEAAAMNLFWAMRKAGLSLLTGRKGDGKPQTCVEDTAVRPADLPAYVGGFQEILRGMGLEASFYGHAASGLLHVRPIIDLHTPEGLKQMRQVSREVGALVKQFKGSLCAEHGVGIGQTEFMPEQLGDRMMRVMREIKKAFDPANVLNPGKIIPDGRYALDGDLRIQRNRPIGLPFKPLLGFLAKDQSFVRNLEQCNGCGACLKPAPTMCPTYIATGDELMSTRGRANLIRAVLQGRGGEGSDPTNSLELKQALGNCLACHACTRECPSNVNMSLLRAELNHARIQRRGLILRERLISHADALGRVGCRLPRLANFALRSVVMRHLVGRALGFSPHRPLPSYSRLRFDEWFENRPPNKMGRRGTVILWDDTSTRYHESKVGMAAVRVLEAAGYRVLLQQERMCCGRPAFSQGNLDHVKQCGTHNLALLNRDMTRTPVIFLEPSCWTMFTEDYLELGLPGAGEVAKRCLLFEEFVSGLLEEEPGALRFTEKAGNIVIHAHCHAKSAGRADVLRRLAERLPERTVTLLDTGCCGMAGAFGMMSSKYDLSVEIARPLIDQLVAQPYGTTVVATGTSCRQQIKHLANVRLRHIAELLAESLA